jgi:NAD(P)H-nitrite reductase large subunit
VAGGAAAPAADPTEAEVMKEYLICRCEEVAEFEVRRAIESGAKTVNDVKRQTRAGMGVCQGVYCVSAIAHLLSTLTGTRIGEIAPMTARPPVRPVPIDSIAGGE